MRVKGREKWRLKKIDKEIKCGKKQGIKKIE